VLWFSETTHTALDHLPGTKMESPEISETLSRIQRRSEGLARLSDSLINPPAGQLRDTVNRVAVEGRAITNIIQNLRGKAVGFDDWYQVKVQEMANDKLLRFFYQLRTASLKQGKDGISSVSISPQPGAKITLAGGSGIKVEWEQADGSCVSHFYSSPEGTTSQFIGDSEGGAGFIVTTADGRSIKKYVHIPTEVADINALFCDPPTVHRGEDLTDSSARALCILYITYLQELAHEASQRFGR